MRHSVSCGIYAGKMCDCPVSKFAPEESQDDRVIRVNAGMRALLLHVATHGEFADDACKDWGAWIRYKLDEIEQGEK